MDQRRRRHEWPGRRARRVGDPADVRLSARPRARSDRRRRAGAAARDRRRGGRRARCTARAARARADAGRRGGRALRERADPVRARGARRGTRDRRAADRDRVQSRHSARGARGGRDRAARRARGDRGLDADEGWTRAEDGPASPVDGGDGAPRSRRGKPDDPPDADVPQAAGPRAPDPDGAQRSPARPRRNPPRRCARLRRHRPRPPPHDLETGTVSRSSVGAVAGDVFAEDEGVDVVRALVGAYGFEVHHVAHRLVVVDDAVRAEEVARFSRDLE